MADMDDLREATDFTTTETRIGSGVDLKGTSALDWGMRNRLSRIFSPQDGRTVMLAFDHGYFQGPTSGLEVLADRVVPLIPQVDAIMLTRGGLRTSVPPQSSAGVVLRASGGPSVLKEELSNERVALAIDDAVRLNAAALAVQVFIGGEHETQSIENLTQLVDGGHRAGIPVLAVTAVGKDMVRDARYFRLATRIPAELGASFVKTYYVEQDFESVVASCPVPIIIAGGKKVPELEALTMSYRAVNEGAAGVDMGRNIFQSERPAAMLAAVRGVVHDGLKPDEAYELFREGSAA